MAPHKRSTGWATEAIGGLFILVAGSLLHFSYSWSGESRLAGVFSAINESTWEHMKIAFWPGLVWAGGRVLAFRDSYYDYWSARGFSLLTTTLLIPALFYAYTFVLGQNYLILDIAVFLLAIAFGQIVFLNCLSLFQRGLTTGRSTGVALLSLQLIAYSFFTYWPPEYGLFQDPRN